MCFGVLGRGDLFPGCHALFFGRGSQLSSRDITFSHYNAQLSSRHTQPPNYHPTLKLTIQTDARKMF